MRDADAKPSTRRMRVDEGRAKRIAEAALQVIGNRGVDGLTHRAIAAEADVPLGSTTYHFGSLDDILEAAFKRAIDDDAVRIETWVDALPDLPDLACELATLVLRHAEENPDAYRVYYELSVAAIARPRLQPLADRWSRVITEAVGRYVTRETAEAASVIYDGILLRVLGTGGVPSRQWIEQVFRRASL